MEMTFDKKRALDYILKVANDKNISQRKLCSGIYDYVHFNKMVNGKEKINLDVLFSCALRLDISLEELVKYSQNEDADVYEKLLKEKNNILAYQDYDKLEAFHKEIVNINSDDRKIKQLELCVYGIMQAEEHHYLYAKDLFFKALHLTKPDLDLENIVVMGLNNFELELIKNILNCYFSIGEYQIVKEVSEKIIQYDKVHELEDSTYGSYAYVLCRSYRQLGFNEKHFTMAIKGVERCLKQLNLKILGYLYFELALAYKNNAENELASITYDKCLEVFKLQNRSKEFIMMLEKDRINYGIK